MITKEFWSALYDFIDGLTNTAKSQDDIILAADILNYVNNKMLKEGEIE